MMSRRLVVVMLLMLAVLLAACDTETGDSNTDIQAAQSFFPALDGYTTYETNDIQDALATALGSTAAVTGNVPLSALVERINTLIDCYRDVGAVDAQIYVRQVNLNNVAIPVAGVLAVVNEDRVRNNFLACISQTPLDGLFGTQSVTVEPCTGSGTFSYEGDRISYLFAATDTPLCDLFTTHFSQYGG